ncbi:MAG: putative transporter permease protein [Acidimicrobiaceae bacterium]|nr:putative transporter permease protein [Acidimicrobiaceae bacterium]
MSATRHADAAGAIEGSAARDLETFDDVPEKSCSPARRAVTSYGAAAVLIVVLIGLWQLIVELAHYPAYLIPTPTEVASSLWHDWNPILGSAARTTLVEVLIGYAIATAAGIGIAVALHLIGPLRRAVYPLLIASQTIPVVVLAPILVVLFGYGIVPKLVIVALICFFPVVVNGLDGLRSVDDDFIRMMRTLDASRLAIFRRVEFPAALPLIFSGMRISATFASIGAVFGEWAGSNAGLGYVMLEATPNLQTARIFAAIVILTVVSILLFGAVSLAERFIAPWARQRDRT